VAALVLSASVAIMTADLIRMSILAGRHLEALELELGKIIAIIAVLALGPSLYEGGWEDLEGGALVFAIGMAGLILTRWTRRGDKREITKFLASTLDAGSP